MPSIQQAPKKEAFQLKPSKIWLRTIELQLIQTLSKSNYRNPFYTYQRNMYYFLNGQHSSFRGLGSTNGVLDPSTIREVISDQNL